MQATAACADTDSDLYQAIVDQAPDVIIFADCEGAIRVWNHGAETVFGHSAAEVLGESLDVIIPERSETRTGTAFTKPSTAARPSTGTRYSQPARCTRMGASSTWN